MIMNIDKAESNASDVISFNL